MKTSMDTQSSRLRNVAKIVSCRIFEAQKAAPQFAG
jgi:hypothetical protein